MPVKLCTDGKEVGLREAVDYLERQYGIPSGHMRMVSVTGEVGAPIAITVVVFMQDEKPAAGPVVTVQCPYCTATSQDLPAHLADYHSDRTDDLGTPLDAADVGDAEARDRPFCLNHGAGCSGWPRHEGWTPSELDA